MRSLSAPEVKGGNCKLHRVNQTARQRHEGDDALLPAVGQANRPLNGRRFRRSRRTEAQIRILPVSVQCWCHYRPDHGYNRSIYTKVINPSRRNPMKNTRLGGRKNSTNSSLVWMRNMDTKKNSSRPCNRRGRWLNSMYRRSIFRGKYRKQESEDHSFWK